MPSERGEPSFTRTFVRSMLLRIGLALGAMAFSYGGAELGGLTHNEWGTFAGALIGLVVGIGCVVLVLRRTAPAD